MWLEVAFLFLHTLEILNNTWKNVSMNLWLVYQLTKLITKLIIVYQLTKFVAFIQTKAIVTTH